MSTTIQIIAHKYKLTEMGTIPEDWDLKKLGDVVNEFISGATPFRGNKEYYINGNIKWVSSGELNYSLINETQEKITDIAMRKSNLRLHPEGTFLMAITGLEAAGTRGRCAILATEATTNQSCMALYPTRDLETNYLFHYYIFRGQQLAFEYCQGTKQQSYTAGIARLLPIVMPKSIDEQKAIASVLSDLSFLIDKTKKLIAKKKAIKQGAMQDLLTGKRRLPGFGINNGYVKTEVGVIPTDWEIRKLGDIGDSIIGLTYSPKNVVSYGKLVHRSSNIQNNRLSYEDSVFVDSMINEKLILQKNDILICVRNGSRDLIGKSALINGKSVGETFGAFMAVFRTEEFQPFIFYLILSNIVQMQINQSLGATINQITNKTLNSIIIPYPKQKNEQIAIANVLLDMDKELEKLDEKLAKYQRIKQGAMQVLLTGKIRLIKK